MLGRVSELSVGVKVIVIDGHSAETMVPLFTQIYMTRKLSSERINGLMYRE